MIVFQNFIKSSFVFCKAKVSQNNTCNANSSKIFNIVFVWIKYQFLIDFQENTVSIWRFHFCGKFSMYGSSLGKLEAKIQKYLLEVLKENTISNWEQILKDRSFLIEDLEHCDVIFCLPYFAKKLTN